MTVCESALDVHEATAGLETRPTQYCLPSRITEILMNLAILELHATRQAGKHHQLHLRVRGVSGVGKERIFEILVHTGSQVSLVCRGLLISQSLQCSAAPVTFRVANGEIMEGGLDEAEISLVFVPHEHLSRPDLGHKQKDQGVVLRGRPAGV